MERKNLNPDDYVLRLHGKYLKILPLKKSETEIILPWVWFMQEKQCRPISTHMLKEGP